MFKHHTNHNQLSQLSQLIQWNRSHSLSQPLNLNKPHLQEDAAPAEEQKVTDDVVENDPTGVMPPQNDDEDPEWFKENQDIYPCFKLAEEGLYDLG